MKPTFSEEDIALNRKQVVYWLRTESEDQRCLYKLVDQDKTCAVGMLLTKFGLRPDIPSMSELEVRLGLDENNGDLVSITTMNDAHLPSGKLVHSWSEIADILAHRWGIE